jgi:hypothetical protein
MDQPHDQQIAAGTPPEPRETGITPPRSLFDDGSRPPAPAVAAKPVPNVGKPRRSMLTLIVLPSAIFIIGVGVIAWVAQYIPRSRQVAPPPPGGQAAAVIEIPDPIAVWTPPPGWPKDPNGKVPAYTREFEIGVPGHYDFEFENKTATDAEMGVLEISCTRCSGIQVAVFENAQQEKDYKAARARQDDAAGDKLKWTSLAVDSDRRTFVKVPARTSGLVRVGWKRAEQSEQLFRLGAKLWNRAVSASDFSVQPLVVEVSFVPPVLFDQEKIELGVLNARESRTGSCICYSATKDLVVKPGADGDPRIQVEVQPLSEEDCRKLTGMYLRRVRSAAKVTITAHEEKDGKQLDLGLLVRNLPLSITTEGKPVQAETPLFRVNVRGEVLISAAEEGGKVDLGMFKSADGKTKKVMLYTKPDAKLKFLGCDPVTVDVEVSLKKAETKDGRTRWEMDVTAKPGHAEGLFPEDGVLILECQLPTAGSTPAVTRNIRIPVTGHAGRR